MKIVCTNKVANFEYFLLDKFEAGIVLTGDEIKSVRSGHVSLNEAFVSVKNGEVFLKNAFIACYEKSFYSKKSSSEERKDRKLLLHKNEILRIKKEIEQAGLTLVPTKMYFVGQLCKVEIAIAKGKKLYDKRDTIKKRDIERKIAREV